METKPDSGPVSVTQGSQAGAIADAMNAGKDEPPPVSIDSLVASAALEVQRIRQQMDRLRSQRDMVNGQIKEAAVQLDKAERVARALTPRQPRAVRQPKAVKR